jgi:uncharacterized protein (DUF1015 family)
MATIRPFRALRPRPDVAQRIASRPYDVLNTQEARVEAADNPYSFLHITKSEIDLPEFIDSHSQRVYDKAKDNLEIFRHEGILFQEQEPCYYIYQLLMDGRSQTGLVCVSSIDDYEQNIIKKHELTRPDKELDRINHIKTTGAQTGNVFLAYRAVPSLHQLLEDWKASHVPQYDFSAEDGVRHILWVIDGPAEINQITETFGREIAQTYIADGHHRAASAAKVLSMMGPNPSAESGFFLTTLFPSDQLHILEYNRVVKDLNGMTEQSLVKNLESQFLIGQVGQPFAPNQFHEFGMYVNGHWYRLLAKGGTFASDPIGVLDVSILQRNVLDKLFAIKDPRTDARIDFVGGIRGLGELENRVNSGSMKAAFSLYPVSIQQLFDIADSNQVMPPKSTWFEPKLRDGLLTHLIR